MTQWMVLYRKEWLELIRSSKLIWMPVVFILLGAMQPIMTYMMPDIIANAGNMPEGTIIEIPTPHASEVLAQTLQQFGTLGLLIIALISMGTVSGERMSGTSAMILVKPVAYTSFVTAKWAAIVTITAISFVLGYGAGWYYTAALFDTVAWQDAAGSLLLFGLWLSFIGTLTILFSSLLRSAAAAAFTALGTAALLSIATSLLPKALAWSPGKLAGLASAQLTSGTASGMWPVIGITFVCIIAALAISVWSLRKYPSIEAV
ncbi:ABC transporter permease [Paenibacillus oenotherae]|uniref:ABC transporter permease n=1 Tax=Paenibacillus oenotherae TaxID=1435645 RepID=A0ABS7D954_9BACL|nr:ABC transporter permease subunit [Paenibacillus oenotherae]MBW7476410.1 ABC transporter permease [Paenibacillus oenotherae]